MVLEAFSIHAPNNVCHEHRAGCESLATHDEKYEDFVARLACSGGSCSKKLRSNVRLALAWKEFSPVTVSPRVLFSDGYPGGELASFCEKAFSPFHRANYILQSDRS